MPERRAGPLFVRYDNADPSKYQMLRSKIKYYNFGISFSFNRDINWAVVYKYENPANDPRSLTTRDFKV